MWRVLFYLVVLCAAAFGAVWISNLPGDVTINVMGWDANPSLSVVVALLILLGLVIALLWWLIFAVLRLPLRVGRAARGRRRNRGLKALSRGMIAIGAGDAGQARRHAREAQRLLGEEPLTLLLNAQVAQVAGDPASAEAAFRKMAANKDTRLIGLRGLFVEARRQGDQVAAIRHAREAVQLAPATGWANEAVLEAQCAEGAWDDALAMIDKRVSFGLIDRETAKRQRAVLLTANALAVEESEPEKALHDARRALKFAPTLMPAALLVGRVFGRRNEVRKAAKILEKAWAAEPHPELADAYIHLRHGDSASDRLKRAEVLGRLANWKPEARLALAGAALDAREFTRAREVLAPLLAERPTIRTCLLMADIEEAEHGAIGHVREWVARAARAPRDPVWMADGVVFDHWAPFSPITGALDAFRWQSPPDTFALPNLPDLDIDHGETPEQKTGNLIDHVAPPAAPAEAAEPAQAEPPAPAATPAVEPAPAEVKKPEPEPEPEKPAPVVEAAAAVEEKATPVEEKAVPEPPAPVEEAAAPAASVEEAAAAPPTAVEEPAAAETPPAVPAVEAAADERKDRNAPIAVTPQPVVFPILHAPDDPGVEEEDEQKRER